MKTMRCLFLLGVLLVAPRVYAQSIQTDKAMSRAQKRQLLTFVEDVVAVGIQRDFEKGAISNQELVRFGIYQTALRRMRLFQYGKREDDARLSSKHVTDAVTEYFGKTVRHQSIGDWKYRKGYYIGYHELFEQLGPEQIKRLEVDGIGKSYLTVYAEYVDSMASSDSNQDVIVKTKMRLKKVFSRGRSHYILIAYKSLNQNFSR